MTRTRLVSLVLIWLALALATVSRAQGVDGHDCGAMTLNSLYTCVEHAIADGHVSNTGVGQSLLTKVDAAEMAVLRKQVKVAVRILQAFIREVDAQAGIHIDPEHADHMIMHADMVIEALLSA